MGGRPITSFAGSGLSAPRWPDSLRHPFRPALLVLLVIELLYLTIRFDAGSVDRQSSIWTEVVGWSPHYLRLAITITGVTLLLSGRRLLTAIADHRLRARGSSSLVYFAIHLCAFLIFVQVTAIVFRADTSAGPRFRSWALLWLLTGGVTLAAWGLALLPRERWLVAARQRVAVICWGAAAGTAAWICGFLTEAFWPPLARYTFNVVAWTLGHIYPEVVSDPARFVIGTPSFKVMISQECSGYEGVGLILGFLTIYLWLFRKDLRFPGALALLPLGVAAIWILNAARVVALIIIGTSGWRAVALGGFHSQAGWLAFNAVGLGFVALANHGRYFMAPAEPVRSHDREHDTTTAFLGPLVAILATAMLTGAFSAGIDWLYPLRIFAAGAVLWMCRKSYLSLTWTFSWRAVAIGFVTFVIWLALIPEGSSANARLAGRITVDPVPLGRCLAAGSRRRLRHRGTTGRGAGVQRLFDETPHAGRFPEPPGRSLYVVLVRGLFSVVRSVSRWSVARGHSRGYGVRPGFVSTSRIRRRCSGPRHHQRPHRALCVCNRSVVRLVVKHVAKEMVCE